MPSYVLNNFVKVMDLTLTELPCSFVMSCNSQGASKCVKRSKNFKISCLAHILAFLMGDLLNEKLTFCGTQSLLRKQEQFNHLLCAIEG